MHRCFGGFIVAMALATFGCSSVSQNRAASQSAVQALSIPTAPGIAKPLTLDGAGYWKLGEPKRNKTTRQGKWILGGSAEEVFVSVDQGDPHANDVVSARKMKASVPDILYEEIPGLVATVALWGFTFESPARDKPLLFHCLQGDYSISGFALLPAPADEKMGRLRKLLSSLKVKD